MAPPTKRRKVEPVAELTFDPDARQEYLTGFHKRKQQRIKHAQETAQKRDKEEKVQNRREVREQRKKDLERHVAEVNALLKKQADSSDEEDGEEEVDDEWAGFDDVTTGGTTDEYIDEGKFTTVTVKELDDIRDFESASEDEDTAQNGVCKDDSKTNGREQKQRNKPKKDHPKQKKKKFRYESPLERQAGRKKQKMKNAAAAKSRRAD